MLVYSLQFKPLLMFESCHCRLIRDVYFTFSNKIILKYFSAGFQKIEKNILAKMLRGSGYSWIKHMHINETIKDEENRKL